MSDHDEGPSDEDLDRFSGETGHCPSCGSEIWDDAPVCPDCGAMIEGETTARPPHEGNRRRAAFVLVAVVVAAAFLLAVLRLF